MEDNTFQLREKFPQLATIDGFFYDEPSIDKALEEFEFSSSRGLIELQREKFVRELERLLSNKGEYVVEAANEILKLPLISEERVRSILLCMKQIVEKQLQEGLIPFNAEEILREQEMTQAKTAKKGLVNWFKQKVSPKTPKKI